MITLKPPFWANNMEGLYKKIIKGSFAPIPDQYSADLSMVVKALLNIDPVSRPDCT